MSRSIPVIAEVDVLVIGGTSAGVAAALAGGAGGASVMVVAPRAYLGEDIAGRYAFWDKPDGRQVSMLAEAVFGDFTAPPTPMHVKLALESKLVEAGVPLVLNTLPAGVITDTAGRACGAVITNRAGRQAILAGHVIDASVEGTLLHLAGHPCRTDWRGWQRVTHVTLCHGAGRDADGLAVEHLPGFIGEIDDKPYELSARRYTLEVDLGDGSPEALARAEAEVVERCWVPEEYLHQEQLVVPRDADPQACASDVQDPDAYTLSDGLVALSPSGPITPYLAASLDRPAIAMSIGEAVGQALAKRPRRPAPHVDDLSILCHGAVGVPLGEVLTLTDPLRPGGRAAAHLPHDPGQLPRLGRYDVLVVGGGTAGAPAAIAAASSGGGSGGAGCRAAIIEPMPALGGVGTVGQITKYWFGNRVGFTQTIDRGVRELEFSDALKTAQGSWSVAAKSAYFHRRCHELGVAMWLRCFCVGVWVERRTVRGVVVAGPYGFGLIEAGVVVDSTGCADIPAAAGTPTVAIGADHAAVQGVGLAGLRPGRDYHNSDHNFSDDTDLADTTAFLVGSKRKFAGHFDMGQLVDTRERRQAVGELTLDPVDFLYERRFPDTICVARSNFDSHGYTVHPVFMLKPPTKHPLWADVPYRCLLPRGLRGVLVTGLGVSAHRDALPVIRMQADVQNQGYAAGRAAAMAALAGVDVRQIDLRSLQRHLVEIGCLPQRVLKDRDSFPVDEAVLDRAVREGWDDFAGLALIFADADRAKPKLHAAFAAAEDRAAQERYALILALMGDDSGCDVLRQAVADAAWDAGWNYRGMGQFGMTLSPADALIVGLGRVGGADSWPTLLAKAASLRQRAIESGELPEFSHCRALAMAFEALAKHHPHAGASAALASLLRLPGAAGHAQTSLAEVLHALTDDPNDNHARNLALRELYLARATFRCGDSEALGQRTLRRYANDLRGHFARHARAVLAEKTPPPRSADRHNPLPPDHSDLTLIATIPRAPAHIRP